MTSSRKIHYPYHLMKLIAKRLGDFDIAAPPEPALLSLLETLYFASLKTDESRRCRCTVNYGDPNVDFDPTLAGQRRGRWSLTRFNQPLRLDVRALTKLSAAADPNVSSLAVFHDESNHLFVWGIVDQELRYGDYIAQHSGGNPVRPGAFQATITGSGLVSVSKNYELLASLEQNTLVEEYHDVLWSGPVHKTLRSNLHTTLAAWLAATPQQSPLADSSAIEEEMLVRWQNAICRVLLNIQQYRHGGGLLIVPRVPAPLVDIKYQLTYDRLPGSLLQFVSHQLATRRLSEQIAKECQLPGGKSITCDQHLEATRLHDQLEEYKNQTLGCTRFIASLTRVDGFVLLDQSLTVHGFGVELRASSDAAQFAIAGDARATREGLRSADPDQFGTRHRAMIRYCQASENALGFVVSQDGDVRAVAKVGDQVILWENINVQLAFRTENRGLPFDDTPPAVIRFPSWPELPAVEVANVGHAPHD